MSAAEKLLVDLRHFENGGTVENPKALLREAIAYVEKLQSAAHTLGKIIDDSLMDVARATDSLDLLDEDHDGDWMLIFERLAELRPARDAAVAALNRVRDLHSPTADCTDELVCTGCGVDYGDCPTIAAIDGES